MKLSNKTENASDTFESSPVNHGEAAALIVEFCPDSLDDTKDVVAFFGDGKLGKDYYERKGYVAVCHKDGTQVDFRGDLLFTRKARKE